MSKRVLRGTEPDGDYKDVLTGKVSKQDLRLRTNQHARAAYAEDRQLGYQEGLAKGREDGKAEALASAQAVTDAMLQALTDELRSITDRISAAAERYWIDSEAALRELAVALAQKLLKTELNQHPDAILSVVRDAALRVANSRDVRVRVSLTDLPTLRAHHAQLLSGLEGVGNLEIVAAADITPGGCVVESLTGVVDATIETQIGQLSDAMQRAA